jgi:ribonuclease PH
MNREGNRQYHELRNINIDVGYNKYAEGSCLIRFGNTHVLCTASVDTNLPPFLRNSNQGWVTAEYSMLPRSTHTRLQREAAKGKIDGRTHEIQRLIGRSLRAGVNLSELGPRQIFIDCDVLQADGGTRTAAITGGFIALCEALKKLYKRNKIKKIPIISQVAAVSCGIRGKDILLDIDYQEDSSICTDANFVFNDSYNLIEIQGSAEKNPFTTEQLNAMLDLAKDGVKQLFLLQKQALNL